MPETFYDISLPVEATTAIWPGDTAFQYQLNWDMRDGATVNVGTVTMSVHCGTHIDAPFHFDPSGAHAGELDLAPFWGPALVVDVADAIDADNTIGWEPFAGIDFARTPRLLLRTNTWSDLAVFPAAIPALSLDAAARLAASGVLLLGVDLPSVDLLDSPNLPVHHVLDARGVRILECLNLRGVPTGEYELTALPLRLMDADGAPVRAALRRG